MAQNNPVFLSYSWGQTISRNPDRFRVQEIIKKVYDGLLFHGLEPWMDIYQIKGGNDLTSAMQDGIAKCRVVVAFITRAYVQSRNCQEEIKFTYNENRRFIAVYLEDVADELLQTGPMKSLLGRNILRLNWHNNVQVSDLQPGSAKIIQLKASIENMF